LRSVWEDHHINLLGLENTGSEGGTEHIDAYVAQVDGDIDIIETGDTGQIAALSEERVLAALLAWRLRREGDWDIFPKDN